MSNSIDIEDLDYFPDCSFCGAEFTEQEDVDLLIYSRTTASSDEYICPECGYESISISLKT